jgi:hypothetical protein
LKETSSFIVFLSLFFFHVGIVCRPGTKVFKGREPKQSTNNKKVCREIFFSVVRCVLAREGDGGGGGPSFRKHPKLANS